MPSPQQDLFALVVPDLPALRKQFSYSVPERFTDRVRVGTQVRVDVQGRRVAGWVVELADRPPPGVAVRPITVVRGIGPPQSVVEIAKWASWRWAGALAFGLRTASSEKVVANLPPVAQLGGRPPEHDSTVQGLATGEVESLMNADGGPAIVRIGPSGDRLGVLRVAADLLWKDHGNDQADPAGVLVLAPTHAQANEAAGRLKRSGYPVALLPDEWAMARAGRCVVVGTMSAAFAPLGRLAAAVVLDAHDEGYHAEAAPTWCAWELVQERAKRDGAPLVLVSPCPTLDVLRAGRLVVTDRISERRVVASGRGGRPQAGRSAHGSLLRARRKAAQVGGRAVRRCFPRHEASKARHMRVEPHRKSPAPFLRCMQDPRPLREVWGGARFVGGGVDL